MRDSGRLFVWLLAILGAIGLLLYLFVFDTWVIPGDDPQFVVSIEPNLRPNDRILTRRGGVPAYGQLARCQMPDGSGRYVVGRLFGAGGDRLKIAEERVSVNDRLYATRFKCGTMTLANPVTQQPRKLDCIAEDNGAFTYNVLIASEYREGDRSLIVPAARFYLVSDNRHLHFDSRDFGEVDPATCERIVFRLWGDQFTDGSRRFNLLW
ncbi:MAG: signal peptidase I [Deltaproteobacteria bacterium]|nr:signal peptidase I [Deltaproteobacteria bacterium]